MGIPKTSRKGKKAWRSNISTADVDNFFVQTDKDARSGGPLTDVSSDSLFFLDKSKDYSIKRKIEKHRSKVLHYDSILQNNPFTSPIPTSKKKKQPPKAKPPPTKTPSLKPAQSDQKVTGALFDIWDDKGNSNGKVEEGQEKKHLKWKPKKSVIPAVEVELPGCSFNPPFEAHQDALAVAVAEEMQKIYRKELEPPPVPSRVPADAVTVDEEDMCFLDVDVGMDENLDANDDECDMSNQGQRPLKIKKLTRSELNRKARRKEHLKIEEEKKMREKVKRDVECIPVMIKDIENEEEEREKKRLRRAVAKQERLAKGPPRLGSSKFVPEPLQVLLSEEITGSIRKLKDYIHRVGRTARAGRSGLAVSLVTQYDVELYQRIEQLIGKKLTTFPAEQEEVLQLYERVNEAQRISATKIREKDGDKKHKKRRGDDGDDGDEGFSGPKSNKKLKLKRRR